MTSHDFDIVIIGGGCVGASILHEISLRSPGQVALVDNGGASLSATARSGGMLRALHESPEHTRLALRHLELMRRYQEKGHLNAPVSLNGNLYFLSQERLASYEESLALMREAGHGFEILTPDEGAGRFPAFCWKENERAVFEPDAGHVSPSHFVEDLLLHSGLTARFMDFEVRRVCQYLDRFRISGDAMTLTAKRLVLAGGARLLPRLADLQLNLPLEVRRLTVYKAQATEETKGLPNFFDRETLNFARFGEARDQKVVLSDPRLLRVPEKPWRAPVETVSAEDCYAPERRGFVGQVPGQPRLYLATGWGGTAFKFALEIGRKIATAIECDVPERRITYAQC